MKQESGRSMIEIVGVLAIGLVMIVSAYNMYKSIDQRQKRLVASEAIEDVAKKTKILYEYSDYKNVSLTALRDKGAISDTRAPIGTSWSVAKNGSNTKEFLITLNGLTFDECEYFVIKKADWAKGKIINGSKDGKCNSNSNVFAFIVE